MSNATITRPTEQAVATDDTTRTHIVNWQGDSEPTEAYLMRARVEGFEVTALCGHKWIPARDPEKFPVCDACLEAANIMIADLEGGN
ncbi:DUF3039 domain-containing protein [Frondihabitans sp. VKM Ac-2883]|uniref:DUF3039 domain-containing protein n=1 Tax=Frondihabitans sp. VKM Ac-2883 TaxID=2783823 RepID=UPI00188BA1D0|nr:DUF3039 domain-containing protein [Frondihabitans sp. VKM Ac-2883]MBF4574696.1 DUF3039 domain-containing protein [Frondihabitans sp. VKM Ac-2883]